MSPRGQTIVAIILISVGLGGSGCTRTTYGAYEDEPSEVPLLDRRVAVEIDRVFYAAPPECVIILPTRGTLDFEAAAVIERSLERHLGQRLPKVIGALARHRLERARGFNLSDPTDWIYFSRETGCGAVLESEAHAVNADYFLVWAQRSADLEVTLRRIGDGTVLWRARHLAQRSDGGLPLGPISLTISTVEAGRFHGDTDILPSLIDDAVRRIVASLPDVR